MLAVLVLRAESEILRVIVKTISLYVLILQGLTSVATLGPSFAFQANESYLRNRAIDPTASVPQEDPAPPMLDATTERSVQQELSDINRPIDQKRDYNTLRRDEELGWSQRMHGFSLYVLRHVLSYQIQHTLKKAEKNSADIRTFREVHETVGRIAKGDMSVLGTQKKSSFQFKMGTRTDLPKQSGSLWVESSLVNSVFDVQFGKPWAVDPWSFESIGGAKNERYRLAVFRQLPLWNLQSRVQYGLSSTTLTTSLSKQLTEQLRCEVGTIQGLDPLRAGRPQTVEETMKLEYGLRF